MKLLTEAEAAKRLRCSTARIRTLRYEHELTYYPGKPVLIDELDLNAFVAERAEARRLRKAMREARPGTPEWEAKELARQQSRERAAWMRRRMAEFIKKGY